MEAHRRRAEQATRTAIEAQQEAERYAASLEATRIAELPIPTPTVPPTSTFTPTQEPTPTPPPTPTPHPATYCEEWEAMVLEWIKKGNNYSEFKLDDVPDHPKLPASLGDRYCIVAFPLSVLIPARTVDPFSATAIGDSTNQLMPGAYEYRGDNGDYRVKPRYFDSCELILYGPSCQALRIPEGKPFTFQFFRYHDKALHTCGNGSLYRIGD